MKMLCNKKFDGHHNFSFSKRSNTKIHYKSTSIFSPLVSCKCFISFTLKQNKIQLLPYVTSIGLNKGRWIWNIWWSSLKNRISCWKTRFIRLVEIIEWVFPKILTFFLNGKLKVCINYKALNKVTKKSLPFDNLWKHLQRCVRAQDVCMWRQV